MPIIAQLLLLPEDNHYIPRRLDAIYVGSCEPCKKLLISALDATYQQIEMSAKSHYWVQTLWDGIDNHKQTHTQLLANLLPFSDQNCTKPKKGHYSQTVHRARMKVHHLSEDELNDNLLNLLRSKLIWLDIRNHIIRLWYQNPKRRLDVSHALIDVPQQFHNIGCRIFTYMECAGIINFGIMSNPFHNVWEKRYEQIFGNAVAVVGAGFAGLTAARQLTNFGFNVTVFEARDQPGGRAYTDVETFSTGVDLGAILVVGIDQNPVAILAAQANASLRIIDSTCPVFDIDGKWVESEIDIQAEEQFSYLVRETEQFRQLSHVDRGSDSSLGEALQTIIDKKSYSGDLLGLKILSHSPLSTTTTNLVNKRNVQDRNILSHKRRRVSMVEPWPSKNHDYESIRSNKLLYGNHSQPTSYLTSKEDGLVARLLSWHIADLEYGCASVIDDVSLNHWDQDDPHGFGGYHAYVKNGYRSIISPLVGGLHNKIRYNTKVISVFHSQADHAELQIKSKNDVEVERFRAVLITIPLGCLQDESIRFTPALPKRKMKSIHRLGSGCLLRVAMEFSYQFWTRHDIFGALQDTTSKRGEFYVFWNMSKSTGKPILITSVTDPHAYMYENLPEQDIIKGAMKVLRRRYPHAPEPIAYKVSNWLHDPFSRGVYSNLPVGSSGMDYDFLSYPVRPHLFFAGEHTCRTNPSSCGSAVISGLREAHRIIKEFGIDNTLLKVNKANLESFLSTLEAKS